MGEQQQRRRRQWSTDGKPVIFVVLSLAAVPDALNDHPRSAAPFLVDHLPGDVQESKGSILEQYSPLNKFN
jgi:hypothetical protein